MYGHGLETAKASMGMWKFQGEEGWTTEMKHTKEKIISDPPGFRAT